MPLILRPLAVRDFRLLWLGQTVSLAGDQFGFVALPFLVLQVSGSAGAVAGVWVVAGAVHAALLLFGGALADRVAGRTLLIASNLISAGLAAGVGVLALSRTATLWELYLLAALLAVADAFFRPAFGRLIPSLLEGGLLIQGNALNLVSWRLAQLVAAGAAGLAVVLAGVGAAFLVDAASFLVAAVAVAMIRVTGDGLATAPGGIAGDVRRGLAYVASRPRLRSMILVNSVGALASGFGIVGMVLLAHGRFPQGAAAFGAMIAAWGAGNLLGTVITGSRARPGRRGPLLLLGFTAVGVSEIAIGVSPVLWVAALLSLAAGTLWAAVEVIVPTFLQQESEAAMRGRVLSLGQLGDAVMTPLGTAMAGLLSGLGATVVMAVCGAGFLLAAGLTGATRTLRRLD